MAELNRFPWDKVSFIWNNARAGDDRQEMLTEHLEDLKAYETELMERLLLVRSEIDDAESYLGLNKVPRYVVTDGGTILWPNSAGAYSIYGTEEGPGTTSTIGWNLEAAKHAGFKLVY